MTAALTTAEAIVLTRTVGTNVDVDDFATELRPLSDPQPGEVTVRNVLTSVDPYMLPRMQGKKTYAGIYAIGDIVAADSLGEVTSSNNPDVPVGSWIVTNSGWTTGATLAASKQDIVGFGPGDDLARMSVLGMTGITAWIGLHQIAHITSRDTVLVNAAAGAVGGTVIQLAKAAGCRVIAVAGGAAKRQHVVDKLHADIGLDYLADDYQEQLAEATASGLTVVFDNVNGTQLGLVLPHVSPFGRVVLCGRIGTYGPGNEVDLSIAVPNRLSLTGFIVSDHLESWPAYRQQLRTLVDNGALATITNVTAGLNRAPEVFASLFESANPAVGKRLIRIAASGAGDHS